MKNTKRLLAASLLVFGLGACGDDDDDGGAAADGGEQCLDHGGCPEVTQTMTPIDGLIEGNPELNGSATLERYADKVVFTGDFTLEPGNIYTAWWVFWNAPENCVGFPFAAALPDIACAPNDMLSNTEEVKGAFLYLGFVEADANGLVTLTDTWGVEREEPVLVAHTNGKPLYAPLTAEVHMVFQDHGPKSDDPAAFALQTTAHGGVMELAVACPEMPEADLAAQCGDKVIMGFAGL